MSVIKAQSTKTQRGVATDLGKVYESCKGAFLVVYGYATVFMTKRYEMESTLDAWELIISKLRCHCGLPRDYLYAVSPKLCKCHLSSEGVDPIPKEVSCHSFCRYLLPYVSHNAFWYKQLRMRPIVGFAWQVKIFLCSTYSGVPVTFAFVILGCWLQILFRILACCSSSSSSTSEQLFLVPLVVDLISYDSEW